MASVENRDQQSVQREQLRKARVAFPFSSSFLLSDPCPQDSLHVAKPKGMRFFVVGLNDFNMSRWSTGVVPERTARTVCEGGPVRVMRGSVLRFAE